MSMLTERGLVVLDVGSQFTKCGFAGEGAPRHIIASPPLAKDEDGLLDRHLRTVFLKLLQVYPKDRKVLLCENLVAAESSRRRVASLLFEALQIPSIVFVPSALLCMYASGASSGLVLEMGYSETAVLPIIDGIALAHAASFGPLGAAKVHACIQDLATKGDEIKVENGTAAALTLGDLDDILVRGCFVQPSEPELTEAWLESVQPVQFVVPSGLDVTLSPFARRQVCEVLFGGAVGDAVEPELSLTTMLLDTLLQCAVDTRPIIAHHLVLAGGLANLCGLADRLMKQLNLQVEQDATYGPIRALVRTKLTIAPPLFPPSCAAWVGGSIIGELLPAEAALRRDEWLKTKKLPDWTEPAAPPQQTAPSRKERLSLRRSSLTPRAPTRTSTLTPSLTSPVAPLPE
mmetsp:Transcript_15726/g.37509  ORF Transcript_15726/g.37509 Transcript_15726/m.37509 type:complete len:403 (-) Transcript_15726:27-1235(-)